MGHATHRRLSQWQRVLSLALLAVACLSAVEAAPSYSFQHYGAGSGLGNLAILTLLQDKAGYLWAGTEAGLYRYDGSRFHLVGAEEGLACLAEIRGLAEARDGALWVVACNHLYRSFKGQFEVAVSKEILTDSMQGIVADGEDGVLVGVEEGLLQVSSRRDDAGKLTVRAFSLPAEVQGKPIRGLCRSGDTLWFGGDKKVWSLTADRFSRYGAEEGLPAQDWDAIAVTASGDIWARSKTATLWKPKGLSRFREVAGLPPSFSYGYLGLSADGSALIPTTNGLGIANGRSVQMVGDDQGLRTSLTSAVLEDRQGSIWVGSLGEGLARWLGRNEWESWGKGNGLPSKVVWQVQRARSDRAIWVGTAQGVVRFPVQGAARIWSWAEQINGAVRWLREAPDGAMWLIAQGDTLARIEANSGKVKFFGKAQGLTAEHLVRGSFDREGRLWIATRDGLFVAKQPGAAAHFELIDGSPKGLWDVAEDRQGTLFVTTAYGLWRYKESAWRRYGKSDGLRTDSEYIIAVGEDGALWLRHRYDGIVERVVFDGERIASVLEVKPDGVPTELTALHGFDSLGRYWQGTSHGLSMLADPAAYVARGGKPAAGHSWRYFTDEDGLISSDCDGEAFWADDDGSVWIGTSSGLAHYSPQISEGTAQDNYDSEAPVISSMQVSQRPRSARIEFSTLNFKTAGQAQFAYNLDGGNWINAKERAVTLAALGPGRHTFQVRVQGWGHLWNKKTVEAQFYFEPFWWETWWALVGFCVALATTIVGALRLWVNAQKRRATEWARLLGERAHAEASSRAKSVFLAHMSHEIRTPLHQILGLTDDLAAIRLPREAGEIVSQLRNSGVGLFGLLNSILDFSKIEAGELEIQKIVFPLTRCLEDSVALFSSMATEKGIGLILECDPRLPRQIKGDALRLQQVLVCLISNAIKFTETGEVRVKAEVRADDSTQATVEFGVVDTGIGISQERQSALFQAFAQGDTSLSRAHGGTGLGLVIAKSLVSLMGGCDLSVESQPGQGACFRFSIPFERAIELAERAETALAGPSKLRILVAEDNKINQKIMLNLLARMGYKADLVSDGAEAVEAVKRQGYDVILMDIQMPKMDGVEATRVIRGQFTQGLRPQIFAVTAHATSEDRKECMNAGMDGYLTKPVNRELLNKTLIDAENALTVNTVS